MLKIFFRRNTILQNSVRRFSLPKCRYFRFYKIFLLYTLSLMLLVKHVVTDRQFINLRQNLKRKSYIKCLNVKNQITLTYTSNFRSALVTRIIFVCFVQCPKRITLQHLQFKFLFRTCCKNWFIFRLIS